MSETLRVRVTPATPGIEQVVLVSEEDVAIGSLEKMQAHRIGALHRAFSVTVINTAGKMLVQRRALTKYHSGGLWTNTCCGHPRPGESVRSAARRRLIEEMGISCDLAHSGAFRYESCVSATLVENEYDHVFIGVHDEDPHPDVDEVMDWRWTDPSALLVNVQAAPGNYSAWFPLVLPRAIAAIAANGLPSLPI